MLTEAQTRKFTHLFGVIDSDHSGRIEWADYQRIVDNIAGVRGYGGGSPEFQGLLGQYRADWEQAQPFVEDGGISLENWLAYNDVVLSTPGIYDVLVRKTAEMIFDTFDLDGDHKVSVEEWREFFRCHSIDPAEADRCFGEYDLNGDGYVSRSELVDLVGQFFMSADPEAPGNLLFGTYSA